MEGLMGLDTNILAYALDPRFAEHVKAKAAVLRLRAWCLNPTVVHETYHTLVFKRKMKPADAEYKIVDLIEDERTVFASQTKTTTRFCLRLAVEHGLGGRDALIIGCYLYGGIRHMLTHDDQILRLRSLEFGNRRIEFRDPIGS